MKRSGGEVGVEEGSLNKRSRKALGDITNTTEMAMLEVPAYSLWDRCFAKFEASAVSVYPATIVEVIT